MEKINDSNKKKCDVCGQIMKQYGPYARRKLEGERTHKGPGEVYYACMNEECENFYKSIKEIE